MMEKSIEKINDEKARELIKNDLETNFFVEASAGSGKTTILVERMANMVKAGTDISKICAITFTKAAANEFYGRFKQRLEKESKNGDEKCRAALSSIDLCFMGTIDSFCQTVLAEHPTSADISVNSETISESEELDFYKRFFVNVQNGKYGDDLKERSTRFRLFNRDAETVFAIMMQTFADRRNAEFAHQQVQEKSIDELFKEEKEKCVSVLGKLFESHTFVKKEKENKNLAAWDYLVAHYEVFKNFSWDEKITDIIEMFNKTKNLCIKKEVDIEQLLGINSDTFIPHESRGKTVWYEFSDYFRKVTEKLNNYRFSFCQLLVCDCLEKACEERRKLGKLTYFDYQYYLAKVLENDAKNNGTLIKHIYNRHSCFLLDEFQDTNPIQAEIFFYLSAKTLHEDWKKCIPHNGSLFIVGDPKQSIYRFRSADVTSYQNVKKLFSGDVGKVVSLSCNFRSTLQLCEYFNNTFSHLMPVENDDQSKYPLIPYDEKENGDDCFGGIFSYQKDKSQPEQILDIVKTLVDNENFLIFDTKTKQKRKIKYQDFMVITSGKGSLGDYSTVFSRAKIPFYMEGASSFDKCPALVNLIKIYAAIANPNDRMKIVDVLCSDVYRIDASIIAKYIIDGNSLSLFGNTDSPFSEAIAELNRFVTDSCFYSPAALFSAIMNQTKLIEASGPERIEYLYFALELIREKTATTEIDSIAACSEYLEQLLHSSGEERCLSFEMKQNSVHFANLHKVKGLEAPIVILASGRKQTKTPSIRIDYSGQPPECYCFAISERLPGGGEKKCLENTLYPAQTEAESNSVDAEYKRLLYVAATRAKNALIIGYEATSEGSTDTRNTWLPLLENQEITSFEFSVKAEENNQSNNGLNVHKLLEEGKINVLTDSASKEPTYEIKLPSKIKLSSATKSDEFTDSEENAEERKKKKNPALVGTIVHRLMELLVISRGKINLEDAINDICLDYDAEDPYYKTILSSVGTRTVSGGYEQENGSESDILSELLSSDEVFCELPFCRKIDDKQIWHGVMDVVYRKGDNWHIVDYKTNDEAEDLDTKYQNQLNTYKEAFKELTGNDADVRIYHIDV